MNEKLNYGLLLPMRREPNFTLMIPEPTACMLPLYPVCRRRKSAFSRIWKIAIAPAAALLPLAAVCDMPWNPAAIIASWKNTNSPSLSRMRWTMQHAPTNSTG